MVAWEDISGTWVGDDGATIIIRADGTCEASNINTYRITKDFPSDNFTRQRPLCKLYEGAKYRSRDFEVIIDESGIDIKIKSQGKDQRLEVYRFDGDPDDLTDVYRFRRK